MVGTTGFTKPLKPVQIRELRGGMWVAVADGSEPLVVSEGIAKVLREPSGIEVDRTLRPLAATLSDAGFVEDSVEPSLRPPSAPAGEGPRAARAVLGMFGAALLVTSTALLVQGGVPDGADTISAGPNPLLAVAVAVGVAIATAIPHELAHVVLGRASGRRHGSVQVQVHRASAATNLTHVWTWPASPRLAAVAAGIVVDLVFLTVALVLRATTGSSAATVAVAVMVMRVVWQLRIHRNCDGRHIARMIIDNPMIDADTRQAFATRSWTSVPRSAWLWVAVVAVGVLVEIGLFAVWLVPAVLRLAGVL